MKILKCNNPSCSEAAHIYPNGDLSEGNIIKFGITDGRQRYKCNTCLHIWREGATPQNHIQPKHWQVLEIWLGNQNKAETARILLKDPDFGSTYNKARVQTIIKNIRNFDYSGYEKINGNPVYQVKVLKVGSNGETYKYFKSIDLETNTPYHTVIITTIDNRVSSATSIDFREAELTAEQNLETEMLTTT